MSRRKEIALLISLGASKEDIKKLFFLLGLSIGGGGIAFGIISGLGLIELLRVFPIIKIPSDVYGVSSLPLDLLLSDFLYVLIGSCLIVALSSFYPAKKASTINVLDTLRNE